jgi:hypothetical protein
MDPRFVSWKNISRKQKIIFKLMSLNGRSRSKAKDRIIELSTINPKSRFYLSS